jgi:hypothetical protein
MSMMKRYRGHLILLKVHQEPHSNGWKGTIHIQFNEDNLTFRDVQLPEPTARFATEKKAEKYGLKQGKKWVDDRVRQVKIFDRKESRWGQLQMGIIWFTVAIIVSCAAVVALLAGYVQTARSLGKVSHRVEAVTED